MVGGPVAVVCVQTAHVRVGHLCVPVFEPRGGDRDNITGVLSHAQRQSSIAFANRCVEVVDEGAVTDFGKREKDGVNMRRFAVTRREIRKRKEGQTRT